MFYKEWEIIYKDKNNSALPQKWENKFCSFSAWFRKGGKRKGEREHEKGAGEEGMKTIREYVLAEAK